MASHDVEGTESGHGSPFVQNGRLSVDDPFSSQTKSAPQSVFSPGCNWGDVGQNKGYYKLGLEYVKDISLFEPQPKTPTKSGKSWHDGGKKTSKQLTAIETQVQEHRDVSENNTRTGLTPIIKQQADFALLSPMISGPSAPNKKDLTIFRSLSHESKKSRDENWMEFPETRAHVFEISCNQADSLRVLKKNIIAQADNSSTLAFANSENQPLQLVPQASQPLTEFTLFPKLPNELKKMIWEEAIAEGRVVELNIEPTAPRTFKAINTPVPSVLQVCSLSRMLALKSLTPIFNARRSVAITNPFAHTYFDFSRDTLKMDHYTTVKLAKDKTKKRTLQRHLIRFIEYSLRIRLSRALCNSFAIAVLCSPFCGWNSVQRWQFRSNRQNRQHVIIPIYVTRPIDLAEAEAGPMERALTSNIFDKMVVARSQHGPNVEFGFDVFYS